MAPIPSHPISLHTGLPFSVVWSVFCSRGRGRGHFGINVVVSHTRQDGRKKDEDCTDKKTAVSCVQLQ